MDTGGTFTDFVLIGADRCLRVHKVLSTPAAPERAILQGIAEMGLRTQDLRVVHGSTVATNAALEGKGVKTAFVANQGFADLLTIGRQNRTHLYEFQAQKQAPPVAREYCLEANVRVSAQGEMLQPLSDEQLALLVRRISDLDVRSVAINLLFSYLDGSAERRIASALPKDLFISLSSEVLPEIKEFERAMATWLNAWVGPLVEGYLQGLVAGLAGAKVAVMQSSGDTVAATQAGRQAVRLLLSGPAGGLVGAKHVAGAAAEERLLTFDMGGTSTDVALIDGDLQLTSEGRIGDYPVAVPMVDMHTIGAGGGSIAWLDSGGMLQVGPQSAGADPGPACYGHGGSLATVTDANLLLGRLQADAFLGGTMRLDMQAAQSAISELAVAMDCTPLQAARDIVAVANEHMARALRAISIRRGADPRDYTLVSFGGAGGLHVCALARILGMREALVPVHGGVLSALGMLVARPGRQLSQTHVGLLSSALDVVVEDILQQLLMQGRSALQAEGVDESRIECFATVDLRYQGQAYTLNLAWQGARQTTAAFHRLHHDRYGHEMDLPVELVTVRQSVLGPTSCIGLPPVPGPAGDGPQQCKRLQPVAGQTVRLYQRAQLATGQCVEGPAVIAEQVATTWLAAGWSARVDDIGNLRLRRVGSAG